MISFEKEPWYISICENLDAVCEELHEKTKKEQQKLKECEERNELQIKLAQERKLNVELTQQLSELNRRVISVERVCKNFAKLSITEHDQQRLDHCKENYQLGKELTDIRFDYSAPANRMKGYIKNESRRLLLPFDLDINPDALWALMQSAANPAWFPQEHQHHK